MLLIIPTKPKIIAITNLGAASINSCFEMVLFPSPTPKEATIYLAQILESEDKFINDSLKFHHYQIEATYSITVDRNNNTWDDLKTSGQLLTLKDDKLNEQLFQYYSFYDSRIKNFNELAQEIRLNNRKVGTPCIDLKDLQRVRESKYSVYPKASFFSCWLSHPGIHGIIMGVFESSLWNIDWFTELKTQALSIIDYMEENLELEIILIKP